MITMEVGEFIFYLGLAVLAGAGVFAMICVIVFVSAPDKDAKPKKNATEITKSKWANIFPCTSCDFIGGLDSRLESFQPCPKCGGCRLYARSGRFVYHGGVFDRVEWASEKESS